MKGAGVGGRGRVLEAIRVLGVGVEAGPKGRSVDFPKLTSKRNYYHAVTLWYVCMHGIPYLLTEKGDFPPNPPNPPLDPACWNM